MASRILVLDPLPATEGAIADVLAAQRHDVVVADSLSQAARLAKDGQYETAIIAIGDGAPAPALAALRAAFEATEAMPPVICLDATPTPARRLASLERGAREHLPLRLPSAFLLARLRSVLREFHRTREIGRRQRAAARLGFAEAAADFAAPECIAVVAESRAAGAVGETLARTCGSRLCRISPDQALVDDDARPGAGVYVLDATGTGRDRLLGVLPELRARSHSRHAPILVIHEPADVAGAIVALDCGASDIARADSLGEELALRIRMLLRMKSADDALRRSSEISYRLAATDPLTGLFNRRYAETYLADTVRNAERNGTPFTVMIVDIDRFKKINDEHGHPAGDAVLKSVARRMRDNLRSIDLVARFGGEEFLVVLPDTDVAQAGPAANRLRAIIGGAPVILADGRAIPVTVSVGVTVGGLPVTDRAVHAGRAAGAFGRGVSGGFAVSRILGTADSALYAAKAAGRNRVEVELSPA